MLPRKYPRTFHFDQSPGLKNDDKRIESTLGFYEFGGLLHGNVTRAKEVVATVKMDGENTSMATEFIHARSPDSRHHPSRNWIKTYWGSIRYSLPEELIFCGENLYAEHSISYRDKLALSHYFQLFNIYHPANALWLSWDDVQAWAAALDLQTVPEFYRGPFDLEAIDKAFQANWSDHEGYVVRVADAIPDADFSLQVGKWVRANHIQTDEHWMNKPVVPNETTKP